MLDLVIIFCYAIFAYGFSQLLIYFNGPFDIVEKFRQFAHWIHPKFGELFTCIFCASTWVGFLFSALNYWIIPVKFTPFNIILENTHMWYFIIFMDGMFTCGTTWLLHQLDEMMERIGIIGNDDEL